MYISPPNYSAAKFVKILWKFPWLVCKISWKFCRNFLIILCRLQLKK